MRLDDHFGNGSILQRNERVKLAASFWNNRSRRAPRRRASHRTSYGRRTIITILPAGSRADRGNYEETARRLGLDRRTVRRRVG